MPAHDHLWQLDDEQVNAGTSGITRFVHEHDVATTMDRVHVLASEGAPSGTLVLADRQGAARGRGGKVWSSHAGHGVWFTLLERDVQADALAVLSLRVGLAVADAVSAWCDGRVGLKWPNDVLVAPVGSARPARAELGKLAGVLVEARWRDAKPEWVAIGVGINLRVPEHPDPGVRAAALRPGTSRATVLRAVVPGLRAASRARGALSAHELSAWNARDFMVGRVCVAPAVGHVMGINATGALRVATASGQPYANGEHERDYRSGSLVLQEEVSVGVQTDVEGGVIESASPRAAS